MNGIDFNIIAYVIISILSVYNLKIKPKSIIQSIIHITWALWSVFLRFTLLQSITLNQNDYVFLQVANNNGNNNITAELDSFMRVEAR